MCNKVIDARGWRGIVAAGAACWACSAAFGGVTFLSQTRFVEAQEILTPDGLVREGAPDFGVFTSTLNRASASHGSQASASQHSSIRTGAAAGVHVDGYTVAIDGVQGYTGFGRSVLDVVFAVDAACAFEVSGQWQTDYDWNPVREFLARVRLSEYFAGDAFAESMAIMSPTQPGPMFGGVENARGVLPVGTYRFEVEISDSMRYVGAQFGGGTTTFAFDLLVPSPGAAVVVMIGAGALALGRRRGLSR